MKLKDIPGVMLGKEEHSKFCSTRPEWRDKINNGECDCSAPAYNQALTEQGEVEVVLVKDKVIEILETAHYETEEQYYNSVFKHLSDKLPSILKVKENSK